MLHIFSSSDQPTSIGVEVLFYVVYISIYSVFYLSCFWANCVCMSYPKPFHKKDSLISLRTGRGSLGASGRLTGHNFFRSVKNTVLHSTSLAERSPSPRCGLMCGTCVYGGILGSEFKRSMKRFTPVAGHEENTVRGDECPASTLVCKSISPYSYVSLYPES